MNTKPENEADATEIAQRLKAERQRLDISVETLAQRAGVSRTTQFAYENGSSTPDSVYLSRAKAAGIDAIYVLTGARDRTAEQMTEAERTLLDRYRVLPPKLRDVVDNVALLACMTYSARRDYDYGESFKPTQSATVVVAHDSLGAKPPRKPRKP